MVLQVMAGMFHSQSARLDAATAAHTAAAFRLQAADDAFDPSDPATVAEHAAARAAHSRTGGEAATQPCVVRIVRA